MMAGVETIFWGFVVRAAQAIVEAAPTLLIGLLVAGALRRMVKPAEVRRLLGDGGWSALPRAWALGMLLPVCSFGVLPVARELRRVGVPMGTVLAFALAAPLLNPLSVLYGLTLSEPVVIFAFVLGSLIVSVAAGAAWGRWFEPGGAVLPPPDGPQPAPGLRRLLAVTVAAGRELAGPTLGYCLIGVLGVAVIGAALPFGCLQRSLSHQDPFAPLLMTAVAVPTYVGPMKAMMLLGVMFEHGNSVGAAYVLLVLGAGLNLGLLAWLGHSYGPRRPAVWLALVVSVTLAVAYVLEGPLYFCTDPADHTHAFDEFSSPFAWGEGGNAWKAALVKLTERMTVLETASLGGLALLLLAGVLLRGFDREFAVEKLLERSSQVSNRPLRVWERPIPGPVLGAIALLGLVVFSVLGLYMYYPDAETAFAEMSSLRANAIVATKLGDRETAVHEVRRLDDLTRKLQVGVMLRRGSLDPEARRRADEFIDTLEDLRDCFKDGKDDRARALLPEVEQKYVLCRKAYLGR